MNFASDPSSDTPALLSPRWGRALGSAAAAAAITLAAGHAVARDVVPAPDPQMVAVQMETDCLYWDLCVGGQRGEATDRLAATIAEGMTDPDALYVIDLPQLGMEWTSPDAKSMNGMHGERINRRQLALYRSGYEGRVENALLDVIEQVQEMRPGVRLSVSGFRPLELRNTRGEAYGRLSNALSFVTIEDEVEFTSSRKFDRWLEKMNIDDDTAALVRTDGGWVLAGEDDLLDGISEPLDQAYVSAWPDEEGALDGALDAETFEDFGGDDGDDAGNRISMGPVDGEADDGSSAIAHGLRRLSQLEIVQHEHLSTTAPVSNRGNTQPDEGEPDDGGGDSGPDDTPGEGEIDPPDDSGGEPDGNPSGVAPLLLPGTGWAGPTVVNGMHGDPTVDGADAKAIARWDVVPYQTITGSFEVGVVAFHYGGIERVDFAVNGGPWQSVYTMTYNERTRVMEWVARLDSATLPDGPVEVRAIAYPENGVPRVLGGELVPDSVKNGEHSLFLASNDGGSLPEEKSYVSPTGSDTDGDGSEARPYASIMKAVKSISDRSGGTADGGTVYLMEGDHQWGSYAYALLTTNSNRWLTVEPAPGLTKDDVRIAGSNSPRWWDGIRLPLQRIRDVTIVHPTSISSTSGGAGIWLEDCLFIGPGPETDGDYASATGYHPINEAKFSARGVYVTDTNFEDVKRPSIEWTLARNVEFHRIGLDAFFNPRMLLNCEVHDQGNAGNVGHRDVIQFFQGSDNTIIYGFEAVDNIIGQPIFSRGFDGDRRMDNAAFVNVIIDHAEWDGGVHKSQWQQNSDHVLFWHVTLLNNPLLVRDDGADVTRLTNFSVRNSVLETLVYTATGQPVEALDFRDNHFIDTTSYLAISPGRVLSLGDPMFQNRPALDYRPAQGSPLVDRVDTRLVPIDLNMHERGDMASVGCFER